jgi:hypothetical protein
MSVRSSRSLVLSACVLVIAAALLSNLARADGARRFAPQAKTPDDFARSYMTFILIPAMREAIDQLPEEQRPEATTQLSAWATQVYDAILDCEAHSSVSPAEAIGYLKANKASDEALAAFDKAMARADPSNKAAYEQEIAEAVLDAIYVDDLKRGVRTRTGTPEVALDSILNWRARQAGPGGLVKIEQLLGVGQPIKFPRQDYDTARYFLRKGTFSFVPSQYTAEAEKLSAALPADEISPPDFPLDGYSDRRLMKQIYEHDFNEHSGAIDPFYAYQIFTQFMREDGCPDLALNPLAVDKVADLAMFRTPKTVFNLDKPDLKEASQSRSDMTKMGVSPQTRLGTLGLQAARIFRGKADATRMIEQHGCNSPVVSRFLKNMSEWILIN